MKENWSVQQSKVTKNPFFGFWHGDLNCANLFSINRTSLNLCAISRSIFLNSPLLYQRGEKIYLNTLVLTIFPVLKFTCLGDISPCQQLCLVLSSVLRRQILINVAKDQYMYENMVKFLTPFLTSVWRVDKCQVECPLEKQY